MILEFEKYHGAGNDFIIIDLNKFHIEFSVEQIAFLCDRHFGIGADGLMLLKKNMNYDFEMIYHNSDGKPATMCGNGGRCIAAYAYNHGYISDETTFLASDGVHLAKIINPNYVKLKMQDVNNVQIFEDGYFVNTGSPHFVSFKYDIKTLDVYKTGKSIRHEPRFGSEGTNVNFCHINEENKLTIYTFERGVENETLACGTGSVASAIAHCTNKPDGNYSIEMVAKGGNLNVSFDKKDKQFRNIWLSGPVKFVFKGEIKL
ncbi:MAG: diaminopimelate epimerase [Bacteroidales bacterium]|nr:diaminopimelate epimerase [Bacteroidales bacterium]